MNMAVPPSTVSSDSDDDCSVVDESKYEDRWRRRRQQTVLKARGQSRSALVVIVGAGPAGLTCATYLSRLGYRNIVVYESAGYAGGLRYYAKRKITLAVLKGSLEHGIFDLICA